MNIACQIRFIIRYFVLHQMDEEAAGMLTDLQQSLNVVLDELSSTFATRYDVRRLKTSPGERIFQRLYF